MYDCSLTNQKPYTGQIIYIASFVREAAKNRSFFSGPATPTHRPYCLVATKKIPDFVLELQKRYFFLVAQPLPPLPLLVARPLKKYRFLRLP